jgi:leader peptidase (prepilin peptidase)/N-methyltransferase
MLVTLVVAFGFGTFIGSFLNVCVHRLPRNESIVLPPSRCYACGSRLTWYDNLPLIGWLLLWGHCRWCGTSFSPRYLFAELAVGALTALTTWWALTQPSPWTEAIGLPGVVLALAAGLALVWMLYVAALIDLDHLIIPDELTKSFQLVAPFFAVAAGTGMAISDPPPLAWLMQVDVFQQVTRTPDRLLAWMGGISGAAVALLLLSLPLARVIYSRFTGDAPWSDDDHRGFRIGVLWFVACVVFQLLVLVGITYLQPAGWGPLASILLAQAILGSLTGWMSLYVVGFLGTMAFRRNAMGYGDVKFLAPIGAYLGPEGVLYAFFAAAIVGTCVGVPQRLLRSTREIPFGPYLAVGSLLALVWGRAVHERLFAGIF